MSIITKYISYYNFCCIKVWFYYHDIQVKHTKATDLTDLEDLLNLMPPNPSLIPLKIETQ